MVICWEHSSSFPQSKLSEADESGILAWLFFYAQLKATYHTQTKEERGASIY